MEKTAIKVGATIAAPIEKIWDCWTNPKHIVNWNNAAADWCTPNATNDLKVGGKFLTRMEAKDGSSGFDFEGTYDLVEMHKKITYTLGDGRKVKITFEKQNNAYEITEIFEAEELHPVEMQQDGWQAILDNFRKYVETLPKDNLQHNSFVDNLIRKAELQQNIINTFSEWRRAFGSVKEDKINTVPFEGSWTAGQVAEHLIKSMADLPGLCNGHTAQTIRPADEKVETIKNVFLDFTTKMKSPEFILPGNHNHSKAAVLTSFEKTEKDFMHIAETHNLALVCNDFELPGFGLFTKYEWLSFALTHMQRHTEQLKNISKKLLSAS